MPGGGRPGEARLGGGREGTDPHDELRRPDMGRPGDERGRRAAGWLELQAAVGPGPGVMRATN